MLLVANKERRQISESNVVSNEPGKQRPCISPDLFRYDVDGCGETKAGKQFEDGDVKPKARPQRCLWCVPPHPISETRDPVVNKIHNPAMLHSDTLGCPGRTGGVDDAGEILCGDSNFIEPRIAVAAQGHPLCIHTIQQDDWPAVGFYEGI